MDDLSKMVAVLTGGGGVLCGAMAAGLAACGVQVAVVDLEQDKADAIVDGIRRSGGKASALKASVLSREELERACERTLSTYGRVDVLINGAGGNHPRGTTSADLPFFELPEDAVKFVFDLNFVGTFLPSQVFGKVMAHQQHGVIVNIASMNALRPLTRIPAYSAAKAAVANFTQWLAVHMAQEYAPQIRVVALAPGFFLTEQNRYLLMDEQGELTDRGRTIINHTPMGRFGEPDDLVGAVKWLISPEARFVTGIVIPVDGGFSAYSGV